MADDAGRERGEVAALRAALTEARHALGALGAAAKQHGCPSTMRGMIDGTLGRVDAALAPDAGERAELAEARAGELRAALLDCLPWLAGYQCDSEQEGNELTTVEQRALAALAPDAGARALAERRAMTEWELFGLEHVVATMGAGPLRERHLAELAALRAVAEAARAFLTQAEVFAVEIYPHRWRQILQAGVRDYAPVPCAELRALVAALRALDGAGRDGGR